jgi:hypothetical protein
VKQQSYRILNNKLSSRYNYAVTVSVLNEAECFVNEFPFSQSCEKAESGFETIKVIDTEPVQPVTPPPKKENSANSFFNSTNPNLLLAMLISSFILVLF